MRPKQGRELVASDLVHAGFARLQICYIHLVDAKSCYSPCPSPHHLLRRHDDPVPRGGEEAVRVHLHEIPNIHLQIHMGCELVTLLLFEEILSAVIIKWFFHP